MNTLQEFKFKGVYELTDLIDGHVKAGEEFWNYNEEHFIESATRFSKDTLLHLYIVTTALNYYRRDFRKNGDDWDDEMMKSWYSLFENYQITIKNFNFNGKQEIVRWFDKNVVLFETLFDRMADEVFYLLFSNRQFLLDFNNVTTNTVIDTVFPKNALTAKGTIKRITIPKWVRTAVFHRDKGRCVFCFTDLTSLINTLTSSNFDHIIPLDLFGTNDPCNIQLTCEKCNKQKTNKDGATSSIYIPWWIR
jgi:5-methylcytosine-specific restriction endonuclease McrA